MKLSFLGAAGTVTGSKFFLQTSRSNVLIDCGLFQGFKQLRNMNRDDACIDVEKLDAIILTHAHLDHSGYLPRLYKLGYRGPVFASYGTKSLCEILLPDSGFIQEEDARYANKRGISRHRPALPLYTEQDARDSLKLFRPVEFDALQTFADLTFHLQPMGHIVGASSVYLQDHKQSILFSGDIGRQNDLLLYPPTPASDADWIVMESTYGNRLHSKKDPLAQLARYIAPTLDNSGVILIPSFAVGRAQTMIYALSSLMHDKVIETVPIYVNSPMTTSVTDDFCIHLSSHHLDYEQCKQIFSQPIFVRSIDQSIGLNKLRGPMIVISASGMLTGGRVLHHVKAFGTDPQNMILLVGYQVPGTRGADLLAGKKTLKIHGEHYRIQAKIEKIDAFSAHADQGELLGWLQQIQTPPKKLFLVHGDPTASNELRLAIEEKMHWQVETPYFQQSYRL